MRWLFGSIFIGLLFGVTPLTAGSVPAYGDLLGVVISGGGGVPPDYSFVSLNSFENPFLQSQNGAYAGPLFDDSPNGSADVVDGGNTPFVPDPLLLLQTSVGSAPGDFQMSSNQAISPDEIGGPATAVPEPGTLLLVWGGIISLLVVRVIPPNSGVGNCARRHDSTNLRCGLLQNIFMVRLPPGYGSGAVNCAAGTGWPRQRSGFVGRVEPAC